MKDFLTTITAIAVWLILAFLALLCVLGVPILAVGFVVLSLIALVLLIPIGVLALICEGVGSIFSKIKKKRGVRKNETNRC